MLSVSCNNIGFILRIIATLVFYIRIIIPVLLIVLIIFDFVKVITGSADEKAKSEATSKAVKRIIYAVIVFLVPVVINFIFKTIENYAPRDNNGTPTSWVSCWTQYYK